MLSVICPVYNEEKYIAQFLDSVLQQDYPQTELEILLVDGMSKDRTRDIVGDYIKRYPFIRLIDNPDRIVPYAMNRGIDAAQGEIIMRLDAHASYQTDYFSVLVNGLRKLHADNVGTVCKTDVLNKTAKTLAIREVLGNKFGVGNSTFRTGIDHVREVETVPFGCWPREVFEKYGKYDVRLVRNQDIELNKRIIRGGGKIFILPDSYCTYYARETWRDLAKNNYGNGKWNILTVFYTKTFSSLSFRHFVPLLFILSLIVPLLLAFIWPPIALVSLASFLAYMSLLSIVSLKLASQKHLSFFFLFITFVVLHLSYGWGSLMGIISLPFIKQ
ncbi:MAG: glycosyltransferase family 2 protein [Prevotella sp.]|nr:glycosyltransferase family 2 protein [Prevotella sp.]